MIGAAGIVVAGTALALRGPRVAGVVQGGAGWIVRRVVRVMVCRDVAPEGETVTATRRVRLAAAVAGSAVPVVQPTAIDPIDGTDEHRLAARTGEPPPSSLEAPDLVTPLEAETAGDRKDLSPYRTFGLRDPMIPLVTPFADDKAQSRFSVHALVLVGIAWRGGDRAALLEDAARRSYIFREGDWLEDGGRVVEVTDNSITFAHVRYGETNRFTLRLEAREEEQ